MARTANRERAAFQCGECGWQTTKWIGRCGECQAWGSIAEVGAVRVRTLRPGPVTASARPISQIGVDAATARSSGIAELDRVLGGGLVPGGVLLLAGEPGVGKSTLLLEVAARFAGPDTPTLYVTGEESAAQVRLRADRIGALASGLYLAAETDLAAVLGHLDEVKPALLVLDSVQAITSAEIDGGAGGVTQVREVTGALIKVAKERGIATVIVGHVTKDGSIAGPRVLEHIVDVVLYFEGDRHARLRMLRAVKNRFGPSDEVGCFDLGDAGIAELPDPSGLFLTRRDDPVAGTCVTVALEGRRPLVAEIQALVAATPLGTPRRASSGLDSSRLSMILAVLERRCGLDLSKRDVYSATVGGVRVAEPAADLAIGLAIASATVDRPLPTGVVAIGEIGLAGEIRRVGGLQRRLAEAARLGFDHALVPPDPGTIPPGLRVTVVTDMRDLLGTLAPGAGSNTRRERG